LGSLLSIVLLCAFGGVGLAQAPAPAPSQPTKTVRAVQNFATVTDQAIAAPKPEDWLVHRGNYQAWGYSSLDQINNLSLASRLLSGQADRYNSGFFIKQNRN
jgi:alcohol dehydrogenase (cytochrome c)